MGGMMKRGESGRDKGRWFSNFLLMVFSFSPLHSQISLSLTAAGMEHIDDIVDLVYQYLKVRPPPPSLPPSLSALLHTHLPSFLPPSLSPSFLTPRGTRTPCLKSICEKKARYPPHKLTLPPSLPPSLLPSLAAPPFFPCGPPRVRGAQDHERDQVFVPGEGERRGLRQWK